MEDFYCTLCGESIRKQQHKNKYQMPKEGFFLNIVIFGSISSITSISLTRKIPTFCGMEATADVNEDPLHPDVNDQSVEAEILKTHHRLESK